MKYLKKIFPFLITIILWRLAVPFWNPAGILAIVPIFYYSFIRPINWFAPFAFLFCFLIDYSADTLLFWTFLWCILYAINGFQNYIDLTRQKYDALPIFMGFFGGAVFILCLMDFSFSALVRAIWLTLWAGLVYFTLTKINYD